MPDLQGGDMEARVGSWIEAWVRGVAKRPFAVSLAMLALAVVAGFGAATSIDIEGSTEALFSSDLPFKQDEHLYYDAFPTQYENMFIVVDALTPERAGLAAEKLADALSERPDRFHSVFLPGGGKFFERNAFLYLDTDELEDLADQLVRAQPYLAELSRDGSLRGLASILARGARAAREGDFSAEQLSAMFRRFDEALQAQQQGQPYRMSWAEVVASRDFESDPRQRVLLVQPVLNTADIQPARSAILSVHEAVRELGLDEDSTVRVRITGDVALSYEEMEVVKKQAAAAGVVSFVLVGFILLFALRSVRLVLCTLVTLLVGLVLTGGWTALAVGRLNMISVAFAVLFIGLGVDFAIHFCVRYRELLTGGAGHHTALGGAARDVGSSLALCALTTALGFFAFAPTPFVGVAELGVVSGGGMVVSLLCTLTLLPALLSLPPLPKPQPELPPPVWSGSLVELPVRFPRAVRAAAVVLGLASITLLPQARFDNNPLNVRDPSSESVRTLRELLENGASSPWSLNVLAPDLQAAEQIAERVRSLDTVGRVVTISDFVPANQSEKLSIIEDLALFYEPVVEAGEPDRVSAAEQVDALRHLLDELHRLERSDADADTRAAATALAGSLERYLARAPEGDVESLETLEASLMQSLPEQLRVLDAALGAGEVRLEHLPDALISQMLTRDGRARVQIFPAGDLSDHRSLAAFYDEVRENVSGVISGSAAEMVESGRTVVAALQQALLSALIAVTLVMLLLWRRLTDTALVLLPLALASALTVAAAVLLDIPFNFADVIVLPLLLGIGVDSGIHLVHRARISSELTTLLGTSTARAVGYSALTTIASFGTMGFATHLGLATLGRLLTLGVTFTLLCNLVVLPSLIRLRQGDAIGSGLEARASR